MDEHNDMGGTGTEPVPAGTEADDRDVDVLDEDEGDDLDFDEGPEGSGPAWVGVATGAALALVVLTFLLLVSVLLQGLSEERFEGDLLQKVGFALVSNLDATYGLAILLAAALAGLPRLLGADAGAVQDRRRLLTLNLGALTAFLLIVATPIAVRGRLHIVDLQNQTVDDLIRWNLVTFTLSVLGTAAVALGACLGLARSAPAPVEPGNPVTVAPPP
jgi:hypothetical protein